MRSRAVARPALWCRNLTHSLSCVQANAAVQALVNRVLSSSRLVITATEFRALSAQLGSVQELTVLYALVEPVRSVALPPVSQFHVGAAALGASGAVYLGVNLEFPGTQLNTAVHAEQCAVVLARRAGERSITAIATSATPCGHCRQWLQELPGASRVRVVTAGVDKRVVPHAAGDDEAADIPGVPLSALLPCAFGPHDLFPRGIPLLLGPRHNGLRFTASSLEHIQHSWRDARSPNAAVMQEAAYAALAAANGAHAPYSSCPAGLALISSAGTVGPRIHAGGSAESAAFNPSISPLQAALVAALADGALADGRRWALALAHCILVQPLNGAVSHVDTVAGVLRAVSPGCHMVVLYAQDCREAETHDRGEERD